jgi:hypothetical protein
MKKAVWSAALAAMAVLTCTSSVFAQAATANRSLTVSAQINAKAKLTLGTNSITMTDAGDPDSNPTLTSTGVTIDVSARTSATGSVTLTVLAGGDLSNGTQTIAINQLTWTAGGSGFVGGTSNRTTAQSVGTWTGSGLQTGVQTFSLPNSWTYATGNYSVTLNYTLTSP